MVFATNCMSISILILPLIFGKFDATVFKYANSYFNGIFPSLTHFVIINTHSKLYFWIENSCWGIAVFKYIQRCWRENIQFGTHVHIVNMFVLTQMTILESKFSVLWNILYNVSWSKNTRLFTKKIRLEKLYSYLTLFNINNNNIISYMIF